MLRQSIQAACPEFQGLIDELIEEESRHRTNERRRVGRESLVRPIEIECRGEEPNVIQGFSRDVSGLGMGVICKTQVEEGMTARLHIHRMKSRPAVVIAECRWCERYSNEWYLSGWNFMSIETL